MFLNNLEKNKQEGQILGQYLNCRADMRAVPFSSTAVFDTNGEYILEYFGCTKDLTSSWNRHRVLA